MRVEATSASGHELTPVTPSFYVRSTPQSVSQTALRDLGGFSLEKRKINSPDESKLTLGSGP